MRLLSSVFLGCGVLLVFFGFSAALGFTAMGVAASLAAIATLLYAGASWFATPSPPRPGSPAPFILFDRAGLIVFGEGGGRRVSAGFPEMLRPELERRCAAAIEGDGAQFPCLHAGRLVLFETVPVRRADGVVVCGMLLQSGQEPAALA